MNGMLQRLWLPLALAALLLAAPPVLSREFFDLNTGDLRAELADARAQKRVGLMLFFEQEGCPGCRQMKEHVFTRKDVRDYYGARFVKLTVDTYGAVPLRDMAGRELTEKAFAQDLKIRATPTFVFYDLNGAEAVRIVGPLEPAEFLLLGEFVTSGAYRTRTFARYRQESSKPKGS